MNKDEPITWRNIELPFASPTDFKKEETQYKRTWLISYVYRMYGLVYRTITYTDYDLSKFLIKAKTNDYVILMIYELNENEKAVQCVSVVQGD